MVVVYQDQQAVLNVVMNHNMKKIATIIIKILDKIEDYLYNQYPNLIKHMKKK